MKYEDKIFDKAKQYCDDNKYRFTAPRQYVLKILLKHHKPMGAYDVLEELSKSIDKPTPPTVYRAIDFWREHGFVHKVESLNAYITCCEDHTHQDTHFLVCDDCHMVDEIHHPRPTNNIPEGFRVKRTWVETHGTCNACSQQAGLAS